MSEARVYLGDGVYVEIENGSYVLTTSNGIRVTNRIVLEPEVLSAFLSYHENSDIVAGRSHD